MNMVENLRLFSCLLLFLFTGCAVQPTKKQIEAFRAVRKVRVIGKEDYVFGMERAVKEFFTYANVEVVGTDSNTYDATVRIIVKRKDLGALYTDNRYHYSGARISGSISFEKDGIQAYKKYFEGTSDVKESITAGSFTRPSSAPFSEAFLYSNFQTKVGEMIGQIYGAEVLIAAFKGSIGYPALKALTKIGTPAVDALINALKDEDGNVRAKAAEALGIIGDQRPVDPLINALNDKDEDVRLLVARALNDLGWKPATDNEAIIYYIAERNWHECIKIGKPAIDPLIDALKYSIRSKPEKALAKMGTPAIDALINALKDEDYYLQREAASALGYIGDQRAVEPLIDALKDNDSHVRLNAAIGLGRIGDQRAIEPLIDALKDDASYVQRAAASFLGHIGDQRAVEPLIDALKDDDNLVQKAAKEALDEIKKKRQ